MSVAVGLAADQAVRFGRLGVGMTLVIGLTAVALLTSGRIGQWQARALCALAVLFGMGAAGRASPWLVWPDLAASAALLLAGASLGARGSIIDLGIAEALARTAHGVRHLLLAPAYLLRPLSRPPFKLAAAVPVARGVLMALPLVLLTGGLLASADPVFAGFFRINVDLGQLVLDGIFVAVGCLVMAGLLRVSAAEPLDRIDAPAWRVGTTEVVVLVGMLDAVFATFAVAQVVAVSQAGQQTLRAAGVTYSEYARSGFFQLLLVAGITLTLLVLLGRITAAAPRRATWAFRALAQMAIALNLLIVYVAFRRLGLYEDAYGFTLLRLYSQAFAVWIGVVFILSGADLLGLANRRRWFVGVASGTALATLLVLNLLNPEGLVVQLNTERALSTHKLDGAYLASLSSDSVPELARAVSLLPDGIKTQASDVLCAGSSTYEPPWQVRNASDAAAALAREASCSVRTP